MRRLYIILITIINLIPVSTSSSQGIDERTLKVIEILKNRTEEVHQSVILCSIYLENKPNDFSSLFLRAADYYYLAYVEYPKLESQFEALAIQDHLIFRNLSAGTDGMRRLEMLINHYKDEGSNKINDYSKKEQDSIFSVKYKEASEILKVKINNIINQSK